MITTFEELYRRWRKREDRRMRRRCYHRHRYRDNRRARSRERSNNEQQRLWAPRLVTEVLRSADD